MVTRALTPLAKGGKRQATVARASHVTTRDRHAERGMFEGERNKGGSPTTHKKRVRTPTRDMRPRDLDDMLRPRDTMDWVILVKRGVPARVASEVMQRFRLTQHEICRVIGIPVSTFNRLIRGDKCLGHVASDALKDVSFVLDNLLQALGGDADVMNAWLDALNPSLACAPRDLLTSRDGRDLVAATVGRACHGIFQ